MATQGTIPQPARLAEERQALEAVLASPRFRKNPRLTHLLEYICQKYFEGDTDNIKEYSIAADVFHRPESFDQATDSIVRVEVYRLRKKLREFYEGEGAHEPIEIVVATGHYLPEFVDRTAIEPHFPSVPDQNQETAPGDSSVAAPMTSRRFVQKNRIFLYVLPVIICALIVARLSSNLVHLTRSSNAPIASTPFAPVLPSGPEIRIRCGYSRPIFKDHEGNVWMGDRYFSGGATTDLPDQYIARTRDSEMYLTSRSGTFSYKIPLKPGTYEMRLYFAETTYSPTSSLGGGENSRVFNVQLNGALLLSQFDIVADAGANTADVRVFKDIHPGPDGNLQLNFSSVLGESMINAIEIVPGIAHHQRPIRMVAQNEFFVDKAGDLWSPDTYFGGGQLANDKITVAGTEDPGLYAGERYGNFSYALPADKGSYALTLYFAEKYWGTSQSKTGGVGSRVFDVLCNGTALTRNLDILKEAGPGHAFKKTFHGLHPNAQGKLIVSFVPDQNYASVDAVELEEETE
ncbi:malectin domain-containing carbohydrate-binding protein [Granulicella mallensis]|uniref:Di-glucose binding within endoplasmic reticulum n=1 Tax=Granulicella mallensis (strain ATCC BAA-1857 / DSM 23137 / MP5ACTX8) TaxID=682795 RepID=G8NWX1_GRAMM|nr:malectin domain-containing carbohydrate-binding protein [Granulicella mallensis]AEU35499.1 Di-glucose binding within endoplasmic reticulum [Granulicella mallensis MP5ACTX8]